ncbi:MAG: hypothetical protein HOW97_39780 [Catenulispora sp.]|nr:hypothetical protein [Catenulispora sp.]NUS29169.1 hypothetical protein [Streptomyces sp.]
MITVEYILDDVPSVRLKEDRGRITYRAGRTLTVPQIIAGLNARVAELLAKGHWFQEWKGDIVAAPRPAGGRRQVAAGPPRLAIEYRLDYMPNDDVDITEDRGRIVITVGQHLEPPELMRALSAAAAAIVAGGRWYQEWHGEVVASDRLRYVPTQRVTGQDETQAESDAA